MKKAIVTGANGFVGSALVKEMLKHNVEVLALDMPNCNTNIANDKRVKFIGLTLDEIWQLKDLVSNKNFDCFYHFAWAGVDVKNRENIELQLNNVKWTIDCLKVAKQCGCKRFVGAGSIMEDETLNAVAKAGNKAGMNYVYGASKLQAHLLSSMIAANINIELVWCKLTNAYGVGEFSTRLINSTLRKIINNEIPQFTSGEQNYDFVYIDDVARAFYLIGKNGKPFNEYLIGSSHARPLKEFLLEMKETVSPDRKFIFGNIPFTGVSLPLNKFNTTKTETDTGFKAQISFGEGCRRTMEWLKQVEVNK